MQLIIDKCLTEFVNLYSVIPRHIKISQRYGMNHHPIWLMGNILYHIDKNNKENSKCGKLLPEWWSTKFSDISRPMPLLTLYPNNEEMKKYWDDVIKENGTKKFTCREEMKLVLIVGINTGRLMSYINIHDDKIYQKPEPVKDVVKAEEITSEEVKKSAIASDTKNEETKKEIIEESFQCPFCERSFKKKFALSNHINNTHKE